MLACAARRVYIRAMSGFSLTLVMIALFMTLGVLFAGIFSMARGGDFNKKHGNRLMRLRVIFQGIAILLFALAFLFKD